MVYPSNGTRPAGLRPLLGVLSSSDRAGLRPADSRGRLSPHVTIRRPPKVKVSILPTRRVLNVDVPHMRPISMVIRLAKTFLVDTGESETYG
jgi:hypothetical protein